jgi:hypothetical protein
MLKFLAIILYIIALVLIMPAALVIIFLEFIEGKDENKKSINKRIIGRYF